MVRLKGDCENAMLTIYHPAMFELDMIILYICYNICSTILQFTFQKGGGGMVLKK